ncbi:MAG: hypothetical protein IT161_10435 [Bryobacterales bacterium]|nr:hypothetical protein [Bryobacterales bacterium]
MTWAVAAFLVALQPPAEIPSPQPPPEPPKPKILENTGKPITLDPACGTSEIQEFGLACSEDDPCPVFLELASVDAQGTKLFVSGNLHTESSTLWSVLLASEDGGKTWTEPLPRIRTGSLDQIQFPDVETGFISGHLAQAIPRDPFFLRSTDGGKTWRRVPLFADPEVAVIDQYRFENRVNGMLILDRSRGGEVRARYQRYETNTSGDVWGLRETSPKPIPLVKTPPRAAGDWRLRADAKTKAYRLERKQETRYVVVASFQINVGSCKPDPPPPPPPQPEPSPEAPPQTTPQTPNPKPE